MKIRKTLYKTSRKINSIANFLGDIETLSTMSPKKISKRINNKIKNKIIYKTAKKISRNITKK